MTAPTLIFGWGNPSRGDDALGPRLVERIEGLLPANPGWGPVDLLTDFQLQVEHALDLEGRRRVLFVDASARPGDAPFRVSPLSPARDFSFTSHALSPQSVMMVFAEMTGTPPPPCRLLAIAGQSFELGMPLGDQAVVHLDAAVAWTVGWLASSNETL